MELKNRVPLKGTHGVVETGKNSQLNIVYGKC